MRASLPILAALLLAGCAADASGPAPAPDPSAPGSALGAPRIVGTESLGGRFHGVAVAGQALTHETQGIHWFDVPPGDPALGLHVAWSGTSPGGITLVLRQGDGRVVLTETLSAATADLALPPGALPSGEANVSFGPARTGASVSVEYEATLTFEARATVGA